MERSKYWLKKDNMPSKNTEMIMKKYRRYNTFLNYKKNIGTDLIRCLDNITHLLVRWASHLDLARHTTMQLKRISTQLISPGTSQRHEALR